MFEYLGRLVVTKTYYIILFKNMLIVKFHNMLFINIDLDVDSLWRFFLDQADSANILRKNAQKQAAIDKNTFLNI